MAAPTLRAQRALRSELSRLLTHLEEGVKKQACEDVVVPVGFGPWDFRPEHVEQLNSEATLLRRWLTRLIAELRAVREPLRGHVLAARCLDEAATEIDCGVRDAARWVLYRGTYLLGAADAYIRATASHREKSRGVHTKRGGGAKAHLDRLSASRPDLSVAEMVAIYKLETGQTVSPQYARARRRLTKQRG